MKSNDRVKPPLQDERKLRCYRRRWKIERTMAVLHRKTIDRLSKVHERIVNLSDRRFVVQTRQGIARRNSKTH